LSLLIGLLHLGTVPLKYTEWYGKSWSPYRLIYLCRFISGSFIELLAVTYKTQIIYTRPNIYYSFFVIKPTRCTNFINSFCHEILHVSDISSVHHQEFIHCTLSNGICQTAFEQDQDGTAVPFWSCSKDVYKPEWHIQLLSVQWINSWWWTDKLS